MRRTRAVPVPGEPSLLAGTLARVDFADAWAVPLPAHVTRDPEAWVEAIFRSPPGWVVALMGVRNALVRLIGVEPGDRRAFAPRQRTDREALVGADARHLNFRSSLLITDEDAVLSTVVHLHNWRGRLYFLPVGRIHPFVIRSMLERAARLLERDARLERETV